MTAIIAMETGLALVIEAQTEILRLVTAHHDEAKSLRELILELRKDAVNDTQSIRESIFKLREEVKNMATQTAAGLTALTAAVTDLTTAVNNEVAIQAQATSEISDLVAQLQGSDDAAVKAAADQIEVLVAQINTSNTNLQNAVASVPSPGATGSTPSPTPTPTPAPVDTGSGDTAAPTDPTSVV